MTQEADKDKSAVAAPARSPGRRSFLAVLLGAGTVSVGALMAVPLFRFAVHPLLRITTPVAWSEVGSLDEFASAALPLKKLITVEQRDGWRRVVSEKAVYVIKNSGGELRVLSSICPHLGCSVAWHAEGNKFGCPCHNGSFAPGGNHLAGPPPRGMDLLESKVEAGTLKVHYQYFRQLVPTKEAIG
jgi:Rieske Fe-S protein